VDSGEVQASVVAPVPWFPSRNPRFGEYARFAATPLEETRHGLRVLHPRYFLPPRVGMTVAPMLLALGALPAVRRLVREEGDFDVLDAHYLYPDGVAASLIARWLGKPFTMTARGTDVTLVPRHALPRRMILNAAAAASQIVTVCEALRRDLIALGVAEERVVALLNGVDLAKFRPLDRDACRASLAFDGRTLLCVGLLIERKGHDLVIRALRELPDTRLVIAGTGPLEGELRQLAASEGLGGRVRFAGAVAHAELARYYSAADALVLASSREGLANVLLESIACGNPVIATDVNGTAEVVRDPAAGVLVRERTASGIAAAARELFSRYPDRAATRRHAQAFGWEATTRGQLAMFHAALGRRQVLA
jgi:glycosyltransferase involved in cell wall biosynthesis